MMLQSDIERRRALNRERVRRHRATRVLMKKASGSPQPEVTNIERRRALNRERVRRHRAAFASAKETSSLTQSDRGTDCLVAGAYNWKPQGSDSLYEESRQDASMSESADQPDAVCAFNEIMIKKEQEEQESGTRFEFEEVTFKLKASPTHSVTSDASCDENPSRSQSTCASCNAARDIDRQIPIPIDANVVHLLFGAINKLSSEQSRLTAAVNRVNDTLARLSSAVLQREREPFEKKYNLPIPFATREDFVGFDKKLASDADCRASLKNSLAQKYDARKSLTKNIMFILRKYMTGEVASLYTAQKVKSGKSLFKDTAFSACLLDTIDTLAEDGIIAPVPDNEYLGKLGAILSNARDWSVHRCGRPTKRHRTNH